VLREGGKLHQDGPNRPGKVNMIFVELSFVAIGSQVRGLLRYLVEDVRESQAYREERLVVRHLASTKKQHWHSFLKIKKSRSRINPEKCYTRLGKLSCDPVATIAYPRDIVAP
jgi:hypothetical protein